MTYVKFRETPNGTEYWNKELKRVELFALGTTPANIQTEGMIGHYSASGNVVDAVAGEVTKILAPITQVNPLAEMDVDQLREYAEENSIEVPGNMKKVETIRNYIIEELNVAADTQ